MAKDKEHLNLAFIGHVDHGKSTLVGHLLLKAGAIAEQQLDDGENKFRFVMDKLGEERERGVTIDLAHQKFSTKKYDYTVVDCPGHRDFVKNMITGASQADAGVLVVAADDGVMPQTKEHVFLSKTLGINQLIVAINKIDVVDYSEDKFNELKEEVSNLIKTVGFKPDEVPFIPLSAFEGDNIKEASENTPWYKGDSLIDALDKLTPPEKPTDLPLRVPIQDVYSITGVGTVPVGEMDLELKITGEFNVYNVMSAVGAMLAEGISKEIIVSVLDGFDGVPGRFQLVEAGQPYTVIVDYAHTPDGLENVLKTARSITRGKLWVVFGCGGDRDNKKRPIMGGLALELADNVVVTSDNPRTEDPELIIDEIFTALQTVPSGKAVYRLSDRKEAIHFALAKAAREDVILIAGKGHENYQILKDRTIHFDDKEVVMEYWSDKKC